MSGSGLWPELVWNAPQSPSADAEGGSSHSGLVPIGAASVSLPAIQCWLVMFIIAGVPGPFV
jgi:hypothetical protein